MPIGCQLIASSLLNIDSKSYLYYLRFADAMEYLYYAANPIIYFVTITSFRDFVKQLIRNITRQNAVQPAVDIRLEPVASPQ